jgi:dTDP-4-amino-4,6-dideoxygalactose transaminase
MPIQLFVPKFRVDETLEEIRVCLERGWTGMGFKTVEIEEAWRDYTGLPHAHFLNSATAGLHLALAVLKAERGWADGDEVITSPLTFISTNHAILYENLNPVFADVDDFLCLDPAKVADRITSRTRAVIFVGLGGNVGALEEVAALCRARGLALILDAAHMAGAKLKGRDPGALVDCAVYSYQAVKNMPTADSGMICFVEKAHDDIARKMSWLGISKDTFARAQKGTYSWLYDVEYVGYKYNGNAVMAAMALVALRYLDEDNAYRRQLAAWYDEEFEGARKIGRVPMAPESVPARHLYQVQVDNRDEVLTALNAAEIFPGVHYRDNSHYRMFANQDGACPRARRASDTLISLPMHMGVVRQDISHIGAVLREAAH